MKKSRFFKRTKPLNFKGISENHTHINIKDSINSNIQKQAIQTSEQALLTFIGTYTALLFSLTIKLIGRCLRTLFPNYCRLCKAECRQYLCKGCIDELPHMSSNCHTCSLPFISRRPSTLLSSTHSPRVSLFKALPSKPVTSKAIQLKPSLSPSAPITPVKPKPTICGECLKNPPLFAATHSAFTYQYPLDTLIHQFKHQGDIHLGKFLCSILAEKINTEGISKKRKLPQALVYVPAHWHKRFTREFNQAHFIARELSKQTNIPIYSLFKKVKNTPTQHTLNKKSRRQNLKGSFCLNQRASEKLRHENTNHIAIIDDVMTTGSTANSLAKLAKTIGVLEIDIWVLARTPKPGE